jgi:ABC-type glycerol-3-phosphate transport system substrate-binding protein
MSGDKKLSRRDMLRMAAAATVGSLAAACGAAATPTPAPTQTARVVEVTKVVEKAVTQIVKETQIVNQTQVVEKVVTAAVTPAPKGNIVVSVLIDSQLLVEATAIANGTLFTMHLMEENLKLNQKGIMAKYEAWLSGDDYEKKIRLMTAAGSIQDVVIWGDWKSVQSYAVDKIILPIDELLNAKGVKQDEWLPIATTFLKYDATSKAARTGALWGLPEMVNTGAGFLFSNVDMLKAAGADTPANGMTWIDIQNIAGKVAKPGVFGLNINLWGSTHGLGWDFGYIAPFGGRVIDDAGKKCIINSPEAAQAYAWIRDITITKKICPTPADYKAMGDYIQGQQKGKLAIFKMGSWGAWHIGRPKNENPQIVVTAIPAKYDVGTKNALAGNDFSVNWWGIAAGAKNKAACMDVLYAFTDKDAGIQQIQAGNQSPFPRPDVLADPSLQKNVMAAAVAASIPGAALLPVVANGRGAEVDTLLAQRMGPVDTGEQTADIAFLNKLAADIQVILDKAPA